MKKAVFETFGDPEVLIANWPLMCWTRFRGDKRVLTGMSVEKRAALAFVKDLVEQDKFGGVIDRQYPFEQLAEAHRYVEQGHKRGNVTISVG